ncbi:MAG TPA: hypothetical protein VFL66_09115 [Gaiellaceae bacterium]|nr:hypothetical protein [Gaiellaceae bacterium]
MAVQGAAAQGTRRQRGEALARWAPWGPRAPRAKVERRRGPRLALDYLVRHGEGVEVSLPDGTPVGTVERLVARPSAFWPSELVVRTDAGESIRIGADRVLRAHPRQGRLVVGPPGAPRQTPWTSGSRRPPRPKKPEPES